MFRMAKQVTVLGLADRVLRGVRLDEAGEALVRGSEEAWPLVDEPAAGEAGAEGEAGLEDGTEATAEVVVEDRPLVRAFRAAAAAFGTREFVLSVPLSRLLVKAVRLPAEARDDLMGAAQLELDGISPFPDEVLTPGVEVVADTDTEIFAVVAALPMSSSEDVSEALASAKVHVTRTDATALGWLRGLWPQICERAGVARRLALLHLDGEWDFVLLENDAPVYIRGIGAVETPEELSREVTLSLLQLEGDAVGEVVVCTQDELDPAVRAKLTAFAPVRTVRVEDDFAGVEGNARRAQEGMALDVTPAAWREARAESRFRRTMMVCLGAALGVWALLACCLFGYDIVYGMMTDHQKALQAEKKHKTALTYVTDMTNRVALIERYADQSRGALEVLRVVSAALPESDETVMRSFTYRRGDSVRLDGFAGEREDILSFTERLESASFDDSEDEDAEPLFPKVKEIGGGGKQKRGYHFTYDCRFEAEDEDTPQKGRRR